MNIDKQIAASLKKKLEKQALDVNPAVMETSNESIPVPRLDEEVSVEPGSQVDTITITARADALAKSVATLTNVAKKYGFRPFTEAAAAVEQNFKDLKSGVDLIA